MVNENKNKLVFSLLLLLIPIYLGRIQEMIPFLVNLHIAKITMGIALLIFFLTLKGYAKANAVLSEIPQVKYIIGIFCMALLSIPFSAWPGGSVHYVASNYLKLLLFVYLLIWCVNTEDEVYKICWAFVFTALMIDIVALVNPSEVKGRVFVSSTYDPNDIALLLVIAFPVVFYMMEHNTGWKKLVLAGTLILNLIVIFRTGSRGGLLALVAVSIMILYDKGISYVIKRVPILVLLVIVVFNSAPGEQVERFGSIFTVRQDYNATERGGRLEIWKRGLSLMIHNPLFGCGVDQFTTANGKMSDGTWHTAHNSFIQIGAELGVLGLVLFIGMLKKTVRSLNEGASNLRNDWLARGVRVGFYGFCVGGFFLSWAYSSGVYFLVSLSIIIHKIKLNGNADYSV